MANILLLTHRIPCPPGMGDQNPTEHLLRHLGQKLWLWLGTFFNDPQYERHIATVNGMCHGLHASRVQVACTHTLRAVPHPHLSVAGDEAELVVLLRELLKETAQARQPGRTARDFVCTDDSRHERMLALDPTLLDTPCPTPAP